MGLVKNKNKRENAENQIKSMILKTNKQKKTFQNSEKIIKELIK
jgi:hypothetical protein